VKVRGEDMENINIREYNWRCNYHFNPPFGLINDPNGLCYYNGYYYIFFQWYPYGCKHGLKHWGLIKTKDFINYSKPEIVLIPDSWFDRDGCYSGSSIVKDGKIQVLYTGNVRKEDGSRLSYQCLATIDEKGELKKHGPVVENIPQGYTSHFRDPKVFFYNDKYYFIIGAQSDSLKGRVLLYSSVDFKNWEMEGEIETELEDFGYMWECPNYVNIDDKDILIFSPQGLEEEFRFQNTYQSGYIIGKFNIEDTKFFHGEFKELDKGFDFYAPQILKDHKGRTIMIGWMGMADEEEKLHPTIDEGWIHSLTMARELVLDNGELYQRPLEEMKKLRKEEFSVEDIVFDNWKDEKVSGYSYELLLVLEKYKSEGFEIKLSLGNNEYISLKYDFIENIIILDRNNMSYGPKGIRKIKLDKKDSIKLHIFMDKSALEIYIDDGREVMSSRIFPKEGSKNVEILSKGGQGNIKKLRFWPLQGVKYNG